MRGINRHRCACGDTDDVPEDRRCRVHCECGIEKQPDSPCCYRCATLDGLPSGKGKGGGVGLVTMTAEMRARGCPMTVPELAEVAGMTVRSVLRNLKALQATGRVGYVEVDVDSEQTRRIERSSGMWSSCDDAQTSEFIATRTAKMWYLKSA